MKYRYSSNARQAQHDYVARRAREKRVEPVGEKQLTVPLEICLTSGVLEKPVCKRCGYHVCSPQCVEGLKSDRRIIRGTRFMYLDLIWAVKACNLYGIGGIRIPNGSASGNVKMFDFEYVLKHKIEPAMIYAESITVWDTKTRQEIAWPNPDPKFSEGILSRELFWARYRPRCKVSLAAVYGHATAYGNPRDPCIV